VIVIDALLFINRKPPMARTAQLATSSKMPAPTSADTKSLPATALTRSETWPYSKAGQEQASDTTEASQ
jgi:hypothetical protein